MADERIDVARGRPARPGERATRASAAGGYLRLIAAAAATARVTDA